MNLAYRVQILARRTGEGFPIWVQPRELVIGKVTGPPGSRRGKITRQNLHILKYYGLARITIRGFRHSFRACCNLMVNIVLFGSDVRGVPNVFFVTILR